jgi:hypothetical protein
MKILILVCALTTAAPNCQKNTAIDVFYAPPSSEGMAGCTRQGMLYAAESGLVRPDNYVKVVCQNRTPAKKVARNFFSGK